jgi:hypothetical protein
MIEHDSESTLFGVICRSNAGGAAEVLCSLRAKTTFGALTFEAQNDMGFL